LVEPQYSTLKQPTRSKSSSDIANLVSHLDELVNDQVKMRSCLKLTPELQQFFNELMRKGEKREEREKKSVEDFLMTRRKRVSFEIKHLIEFSQLIVTSHHSTTTTTVITA
jgi:hypothetical protein